MNEEEEHWFPQSNSCWICKKLFDNGEEKVWDHCYVTGKFRDAAHWNCNINFQLTKKVPVIFHNLRGYDSHLIFNELDKFDVKISVIPNRLEKYMACFFNKNLVFVDSMQLWIPAFIHWLKTCQMKILNTYWKNLVLKI